MDVSLADLWMRAHGRMMARHPMTKGLVGPGTLFGREGGTRIGDFIDAASPTLMVVEAARPVLRTKPEDVPYGRGKPLPKLGGPFDDGCYAARGGGSVLFIGRKTAPGTIHARGRGGADKSRTADELGQPR